MNNRNPQYRAALLMGIIVVLSLPFLAFVIYFGTHYPSGHWPNWFANTMLAWFAANFLIVAVAAKRIFKGAPANPEQAQAARAVWGAGYAWLLVVWILLFLLGTAATIAGKIPLQRGIPAGAFLLFFIVIFGRFVWSSRRAKA